MFPRYSGTPMQLTQPHQSCNTEVPPKQCEGTQQGDPLGPPEFCIVVHPLLKRLQSDLRFSFLDDLTLGGQAALPVRAGGLTGDSYRPSAVMVAPSASLASAASSTELQAQIILTSTSIIPDKSFESTLSIWSHESQAPIPIGDAQELGRSLLG